MPGETPDPTHIRPFHASVTIAEPFTEFFHVIPLYEYTTPPAPLASHIWPFHATTLTAFSNEPRVLPRPVHTIPSYEYAAVFVNPVVFDAAIHIWPL